MQSKVGFILPDANALIVHIPKTGGNWIRVALNELGIDHRRPKIKPGTCGHCTPHTCIDGYDNSMVFVRHPLDWYESWWKFQKGKWLKYGTEWHPQQDLDYYGSDDFNTFIEKCIENEPAYVTRMYEWYVGPEGVEYCDFIGRLETIAFDFYMFMSLLGYNIDMQDLLDISPVHVSPADKPVWREDLREKMIYLEQTAIERFGYIT